LKKGLLDEPQYAPGSEGWPWTKDNAVGLSQGSVASLPFAEGLGCPKRGAVRLRRMPGV